MSSTEKLGQVEDAVDRVENYYKQREMKENKNITKILDVVRKFIKDKGLVLYGGSSINSALPIEERFYDYSVDIPDYDFYSSNAKQDAKDLADILFAAGFKDASARSGIHEGTFKVGADFTQVADITQMNPNILREIDTFTTDEGLLSAGPMWLRVDIYKQLSDAQGNQSRFPKVWKRLQLLNKYQPIDVTDCQTIGACSTDPNELCDPELPISNMLALISQHAKQNNLVFVGGYSRSVFHELDRKQGLTPLEKSCLTNQVCLTDLLCMDSKMQAQDMFQKLRISFPSFDIRMSNLDDLEELVTERCLITVNGKQLVEFGKPHLCFGYVTLRNGVRVGTLDTMLTVLFAKYFDQINDMTATQQKQYKCQMKYFIALVEEKGNMQGEGPFARFTVNCYGNSLQLSSIFKSRWESRIQRLMNQKKGIWKEREGLYYNPMDEELARKGLIDLPGARKHRQKRVKYGINSANRSFRRFKKANNRNELTGSEFSKLTDMSNSIREQSSRLKTNCISGDISNRHVNKFITSINKFDHCITLCVRIKCR